MRDTDERLKHVKFTHAYEKGLSLGSTKYRRSITDLLRGLIRDDIGSGDITSALLRNPNLIVRAKIICKTNYAILAGISEIAYFLKKSKILKGKIGMNNFSKDGVTLKKGMIVAELKGHLSDILVAERTFLNFLQRMSGIATLMSILIKKIPKNVLLTGTRKTLWGLAEKKACLTGGGGSHRLNLEDAVLIKDNHILAPGNNISYLMERLNKSNKHGRFAEIEVSSLAGVKKVFEIYNGKYDLYIMFDNMTPSDIKKGINLSKKTCVAGNVFFEASGGINSGNIASYGKTGVDIISIGGAFTSAAPVDFSMKIV